MPERYRFLLRPWWIATHVLLIAAVLLMVRLGFWQLDRLHEKQDIADAICFLAGDGARFINAEVLRLDGGASETSL